MCPGGDPPWCPLRSPPLWDDPQRGKQRSLSRHGDGQDLRTVFALCELPGPCVPASRDPAWPYAESVLRSQIQDAAGTAAEGALTRVADRCPQGCMFSPSSHWAGAGLLLPSWETPEVWRAEFKCPRSHCTQPAVAGAAGGISSSTWRQGREASIQSRSSHGRTPLPVEGRSAHG